MAAAGQPRRRRGRRWSVALGALLLLIASANVAAFVLQREAYTIVTVVGDSMKPTVRAGERVAVDRRTPFNEIQRGDLIVVRVWRSDKRAAEVLDPPSAGDPQGELVVKRVIGMPGERIEMRERTVAIDDTIRLREPYAEWNGSSPSFAPVDLADDELFVLGDNRAQSRDSRAFGPVIEDAVVGTANLRIWPLNRLGNIRAGETGEEDV